jgi:hypothetical protein
MPHQLLTGVLSGSPVRLDMMYVLPRNVRLRGLYVQQSQFQQVQSTHILLQRDVQPLRSPLAQLCREHTNVRPISPAPSL